MVLILGQLEWKGETEVMSYYTLVTRCTNYIAHVWAVKQARRQNSQHLNMGKTFTCDKHKASYLSSQRPYGSPNVRSAQCLQAFPWPSRTHIIFQIRRTRLDMQN